MYGHGRLFNGNSKNNSNGQPPMNNFQYQQQMPNHGLHQDMSKTPFQPYMFSQHQQQLSPQVAPQFHGHGHSIPIMGPAYRFQNQQNQNQQQNQQPQQQQLQLPQAQQLQPVVGGQQNQQNQNQQQKFVQQHQILQQQQLQQLQQQHLQQQQLQQQVQQVQPLQQQALQDPQLQDPQLQGNVNNVNNNLNNNNVNVNSVNNNVNVNNTLSNVSNNAQVGGKIRNKKVSKLEQQLQQQQQQQQIHLISQKSHDEANPNSDEKKKRGRPKKLIMDPTTGQYIDSQHPNFKQLNKLLKETNSRASPSGNDGNSSLNNSINGGGMHVNEDEINKLYEKPTYMRTLGDDAVQQLLQKKDRRGRPRKFPVEQTGITIKGIRVNGTLKQRRKKDDEMFHSQLGRVVKRERGRPKKNQNQNQPQNQNQTNPVVNLGAQLKDGSDMTGMY